MSTETKYTIAKLNGGNYFNWRYKMQMLLIEKDVWNVIVDEEPNDIGRSWRRKDKKAHSTIALNVEYDQIQHIRNSETAKDAWLQLKSFHEKDTPNNRVSILRKLMAKRIKEGGDVVTHLNEMVELFQRMLAVGDRFQPDFILSGMILGSLPESYDNLVTALEGRADELTSNLVCSKVMEGHGRRKEKETERKKNYANEITSTAMNVNKEIECYFCHGKGHFKKNCEKYVEWLEKKYHNKTATLAVEYNKDRDDRRII